MDKRSTHWADVFNWLQVVVDSCKTVQQSDNCMRLLQNFERTYENRLGISECMEMLRPLKHQLWNVGELSFSEKMKKLEIK